MSSRREIIVHPADDKTRRQALDRFHSLLNSTTKEHDWQRFFDDSPFVFSDSLAVKFNGLFRQVPLVSGRPDYLFCQKSKSQHLGDYGVIEIKRPTDSIIGTYSSKFIVESKALRVAIKEASSHLNSLSSGQFLNPKDFFAVGNRRYAFIIIGTSTEVAKKCQSEILQQQFRNLLPIGFQLYTYDELLRLFSSTVPPVIQVLFASQADSSDNEINRTLRVLWSDGIDALSCVALCKTSKRFTSDIVLNYKDVTMNAKSIQELMTKTGIGQNAEVKVTAKGCDAKVAIRTISELFKKQFFRPEADYQNHINEMLIAADVVSRVQLNIEQELKSKEDAEEEKQKATRRDEMIRLAAYYHAQNDNYRKDATQYWMQAEDEIDALFRRRYWKNAQLWEVTPKR